MGGGEPTATDGQDSQFMKEEVEDALGRCLTNEGVRSCPAGRLLRP